MNLPETAKLQKSMGETENLRCSFQETQNNFAETYKQDKAEIFYISRKN